jgi:phosphoribosyl 1,2-cyclic phosphate phosphodiesterase
MSNKLTKIVVMGCGGSGGVPYAGNFWGKCDPNNPKNHRMRPSLFIQRGDTKIAIDTGPDFRLQVNALGMKEFLLDAVIYSHSHCDHINGIDDLRSFWFRGGKVPVNAYADSHTTKDLLKRFNYIFNQLDPQYPATVILNPLQSHMKIGEVEITCFDQIHGEITTKGFRIGNFAYCTDVKKLPEESIKALQGIDTWIVGCHPTDEGAYNHAGFDEIKAWVDLLKPRMTYLTHLNAMADYDALCRELPENIRPAYDGLELVF